MVVLNRPLQKNIQKESKGKNTKEELKKNRKMLRGKLNYLLHHARKAVVY